MIAYFLKKLCLHDTQDWNVLSTITVANLQCMPNAFTCLLQTEEINKVTSTIENLQTSASCELMTRWWQLYCSHWLALDHLKYCKTSWLIITLFSIRSTISTVLKASLGAFAITHDMLLNIPFIKEWLIITLDQWTLINDTLLKSNQECINYKYNVWQQVIKYNKTINDNFSFTSFGLLQILCIHANGMNTMQLWTYATKQINIHCNIS